MSWRLAKSLETLRRQVDAAAPNRGKSSDGTIGDLAHQTTASDHNPNTAGVVTAMDITHDPARGFDSYAFAEMLRQREDPRIKYVISNGRIFSSTISPWQWRPYTGANRHAHHVHISVMGEPELYDHASEWAIARPRKIQAATPKPIGDISADLRWRMAKAIVDFEARRVNGKLAVYHPPANDGGGAYEIAGINVRYHPEQAAKLKALVDAGKHDQAEAAVVDYLLAYTKLASDWTADAGVEFYLRDCVFNRGPKGAARILQRALGVEEDGDVGPLTRQATSCIRGNELLTKLRVAREEYERDVVGFRANLWRGLVNRWDKALAKAREFQKEQQAMPAVIKRTLRMGVGAGAATLALASWFLANPFLSLLLVVGLAALGITCWRKYNEARVKPPDTPAAPSPAIIKDI